MAQDSDPLGNTPPGDGKQVIWRKNVLVLMGIAYGSILAIWFGMILCGMGPKDAYESISIPFVALIGGTLAVVKDLL